MRVIYFLSEFPKLSETFILNQIEGLLDLGEDVRIVALGTGDRPVHPAVERRDLLARTTYLPPLPRSRVRRLVGAVARLLAAPRIAARALRVDRYGRSAVSLELLYRACASRGLLDGDIVHCHYGPMGRLAVILRECGVFDAPVVTTFHGYDLRLGAARGPGVFAPLQRRGDAVVAISAWSRDRLIELGFDPATVIDHPVGVEPESLQATNERRAVGEDHAQGTRLLSVARLVPEKGLTHALDALAALRARHASVRWTYRIVGDGPLESTIRSRIQRLGLDDRVTLAGPADQDGVRRELAACDLFLLPSEAEVLPLALMEAHAAGVPAVASDVGAVREILEDGASGLLVPAGDVPALAAAIEALLGDADRRRRLGARGRAIVAERFAIGPLNLRLQRMLQAIVERTGGVRSVGSRSARA